MNNILVYIGGLLIVVLAALFGVPYAIDWNKYRGVFEEEASRMLGREVRVAGNVGLRLLPTPYVHAEKLRIGGAVGEETGRPLFKADEFTMWLSVPPLLRGVVEAKDVALVRPVVEVLIDGEGRTSLSTLSVTPGRLSFVPQDIALQSVRLIDGSFGLTGPNGIELARLEKVNGEVSADTIEGPFRFRGSLAWDGELREVRLNTARRDPNGDLRFKALVTVPKNTNSYTLDATARSLSGAAELEGALTARVSTRGFQVTALDGEQKSETGTPAKAEAPQAGFFDVTAKVKSGPGQVALEDLSISLEQGGLPQLISGRSAIGWSERIKLDVDLQSKWLDLDQLTAGASAAPGAIPLELARTLFDRLVDELPASADTNIAFAIDQVGLGRQSVSGLRLKASRSGGPLELKDVRASLPGGTNLALDGVLDGNAGARSFTGTMALSGQSLDRFSTWGFGDNPFSRSRSDGPFSLAGNLKLNDRAIELTQASAEVSGTPVIGEVRFGLEEPRRLAVALEGHRIDLGDLWPGNPGLTGLRGLLTGGGATETPGEGPAFIGSDVSFDIRAGELIDGTRKLENVHLDIALQKGTLTVPKLKFVSAGGLAVEMEGAAADVPAKTKGSLRGVIEAPTPEAVSTLSDLLDLSDEVETRVARWGRLTPWRFATTFSFGERKPEAVDISLDGTLRGGRVVGEARIDAGSGAWRSAPSDVTVRIATPDVYGFLDTISETKSKDGTEARPGKLFVKAAGKAEEGLVSVVELDAETVQLEFNGRVRVPETNTLAAKGDIRVDAQDLSRVLALTGLSIGPGVGSVPVKGTIAAAHDGSKLTLASPALGIGAASVSGVLTYATGADAGPASLAVDLSTDKASLPSLIAALTAAPALTAETPIVLPATPVRRRKVEAEVVSPLPPQSVWPEQAFDLKPLDGVSGTFKASIRSLELEPGLAMKDARLDLAFAPGKLDVRKLEGAVLGGKAVSAFVLEKQPAGASLAGDLKISISSTGSAESGADDAIDGDVAALDVGFAGRALSPSALIGAMTGKGQLTLGDVTLAGVAPKAIADIGDQALQAKGPTSGEALQTALKTALKATQLKLGNVEIPVTVADGALRLDRVQVDTAEGRATFDTMLDLKTLRVDSAWKIEGKALTRAAPSVAGATAAVPGDPAAPVPVEVKRALLPPVSVVYAGRLADLAALEPLIDTDALERELTVRRMERDVDELERLRKLDQLRAKQERERQEALEAERQRRQRELEQKLAPPGADIPAPEPDPVPVEGSASVPAPAAEIAPDAAGNPLPEDMPGLEAGAGVEPTPDAAPVAPSEQRRRVQSQVKKKPPKNSWQPFQISPYQ